MSFALSLSRKSGFMEGQLDFATASLEIPFEEKLFLCVDVSMTH